MLKKLVPSFLVLIPLLLAVHCAPQSVPAQTEPTQEILQEALDRTVVLHYHISDYAKGTGLLLNDEGLVLTAQHVILGWEDRVRVSQDSKTFFAARVLHQEGKLDLVLLQTDLKRRVAPLRWVDRGRLEINDSVFLYGAAWGLPNAFLKGYVAHTDRRGTDIRMPTVPFVQTMGTSFPGCSGAGVYLFDGRILGINRATVGAQPGDSTGLVIPAGYVRTFLEQHENSN